MPTNNATTAAHLQTRLLAKVAPRASFRRNRCTFVITGNKGVLQVSRIDC
ncbi:hypothetical protein H8K38_06610 [Undibacterium sp. FT79W]|nr:hypothetical protein [Undibacterium sp. FT79W]MBC3877473.1 hypothetical protein [Undibacterium sp. FT79W]